ncbi:MAG: DeoR/GlpR family DNA-binding transcription regulator [Pseudomonadota bacterium]
MTLSIRQREIMKRARREGQVQVETLAVDFGVSPQTIRRDLSELCDARLLARVHGGAVMETSASNLVYETRRAIAEGAKAAIAARCADEIPEGASLFLGIGTTTEAVARALTDRRDLLIVTNNLNVAQILASGDKVQVVVTGGRLRLTDGGLVGEIAAESVARFRLDMAVLGISAIDPEGTLLDYDMAEIAVIRAMMTHARRRILVADTTKLARTAPVGAGRLDEFEVLVTDRPLPSPLAESAAERGPRVLTPPLALLPEAVDESTAAE